MTPLGNYSIPSFCAERAAPTQKLQVSRHHEWKKLKAFLLMDIQQAKRRRASS
jgi:hypothetical protein